MATKTTSVASAKSLAAHVTRLAGGGRRQRFSLRLLVPYVFVLPFLLLFVGFFFAPFFYALSQSVYKVQRSGLGFGPPSVVWAGADNYLKALHDPPADGLGGHSLPPLLPPGVLPAVRRAGGGRDDHVGLLL